MANNDKQRKSEMQDRFDVADNNGRFAGNDEDSRTAMQNALQTGASDTTGYDSSPRQNTGTGGSDTDDESTNREAHRDPNQSHDYKGDAQNVSDDFSRPLDKEGNMDHARNKAHSGSKNKDDR